MQVPASRQPVWYWAATGLLLLVGAGALSSSVGRSAMNYSVQYGSSARDGDREPTIEELAADFRAFREEVSQLTLEEQQEVWHSLQQGTESLAEQTLYTFFALAEGPQQELLDRLIDRSEARRRQWQERGGWGVPGGEADPARWPIREVSGHPDFNTPFAELSVEERLALRRDLWQEATQQAHAMRMEFFRLMSERRRLRGIPEPMMRRLG